MVIDDINMADADLERDPGPPVGQANPEDWIAWPSACENYHADAYAHALLCMYLFPFLSLYVLLVTCA